MLTYSIVAKFRNKEDRTHVKGGREGEERKEDRTTERKRERANSTAFGAFWNLCRARKKTRRQ